MAEPLLDGLWMPAFGDQQRRVRVAQIVESHAVKVFGERLSDRRLEDPLVEVRVAHGTALGRGEHGRVWGRVAEVLAQLVDEERGQLDRAAGAVGLRVVLDQVATHLGDGREDDDLRVVKAEVAAAQRGDLPGAQAGVGGEADHQVVRLRHAVSQGGDLVGGQEVHLLVGHRRQLHAHARVLPDGAELDR